MPPLRDLFLTLFVFGALPFMWKRPFWALLMWVWLSMMNPHRQTYSFAYDMPFAQVTAIVLLASVLAHSRRLPSFPWNGVTILLLTFMLWVGVSPLLASHEGGELDLWLRVVKIMVMVLVAFRLIETREQFHQLTCVMALSIGFYGVKGGLFTLATGGNYRVWGPDGTFIGDNNSVALAIIMVVPLFRYIQLVSTSRWIRLACTAAMVLCTVSAVGSYSRGALIGVVAMALFMLLKSRRRFMLGAIVLLALPIGLSMMPDAWSERMGTIGEYQADGSAMGRINAWWMAFNLAVGRLPFGGGFNIYTPEVFARYAPNAIDIHAAHSIYFQVLGEHGFIGLFLFLAIFVLGWRNGNWVIARTRKRPDWRWATDLASMLQVSLIGYAVGGAFLSLSYYDFPYYVVVLLTALRRLVAAQLPQAAATAPLSPYASPLRTGQLDAQP